MYSPGSWNMRQHGQSKMLKMVIIFHHFGKFRDRPARGNGMDWNLQVLFLFDFST